MSEAVAAVIEQGRRARAGGRLQEALAEYLRASTIAEASGLTLERVAALEGVGQIERDLGRHEAASANYREAVEVCRGANAPVRMAHALRHLADIECERGLYEAAMGPVSEALEIYRQHPGVSPLELANTLRVLALLQESRGDSAVAAWREARELYVSAGVEIGVKECEARLRDVG